MRHRQLFVAASLIALGYAGAAAAFSAQPPQDIEIGALINGEITADDQFIGGEDMSDDAPLVEAPLHHYDHFQFQARAGQRIEIIMRSADFDTYLELSRDGEWLASDDDGLGEGTNSRLRFTAPEDGTYYLVARSLFAEQNLGTYTLTVNERPPAPPAPEPTPIRLGQVVEGELGDGDPESAEGPLYDAYRFRLGAGEQRLITQRSDAIDTLLRVGREDRSGGFEELAMNDDYAGSLNSSLVFTAPETGVYVVRATAFSASQGPYTLTFDMPPPPAEVTPIAIGQTREGELTEDDPENFSGRRHDAWGFSAQAGQRLELRMSSEVFDTYLVLGREGPEGFQILSEDDDGAGEGTNSRIVWTVEEAGDYIIHARAWAMEGAGPYSLSLGEIAPPPPPAALAFGETIQGEITDEDGDTGDGRRADLFVFSGVAGQRIQSIMRSGDFDTYLEIGHAEGEFSPLASDDDGLGEGLDSRLNFTLPADGAYVLRAGPLGPSGRGLYALQLTDRGPEPALGSILIGETARGALSEADSIAEDGSYYDAWRFHARDGDKLRLTMISNEFDAFLALGTQDAAGVFTLIASDDDSLSDTNALLEHTISGDGWYVVRASSYGPGRTGYYSLTVERQP